MTQIYRTAVLALLLLVPRLAVAQPDTMPITVQPTKVLIGATQFIPRCITQPKTLVVAAGQTVELAADSTFDCVEVAGTLRVSRTHPTSLKVTTLMVLPGGTLDVGTAADPITQLVTFVFRDVPISAADPFQWGNGLINFGHMTRVGAKKLAWTHLTTEAAAGATSLTLADDLAGWAVGDEVTIPDSRQPTYDTGGGVTVPLRRESPVFVQSISGRTITLSKPLDFEHLAVKALDGHVIVQAPVANLTRNIVLKSENPNGTPGHTADIGHMAMWDVQYNRLDGLGRTRNVPLNDTTVDASLPGGFKIGTNPRARYAEHHHHAMGLGSQDVGNVYVGHPDQPIPGPDGSPITLGAKWGLDFHNTHDSLAADNISVAFPGAGFITEDGDEVRNTFRHNLALYSIGNIGRSVNRELSNIANENNPGAAGNGFFMRASANTLDGNEAWDNAIGFNLFAIVQAESPLLFPSTPGGFPDTELIKLDAVPRVVTNNVAVANQDQGFEYWYYPDIPNVNAIAAYNGNDQFMQGSSNPAAPHFVNPLFVGFNGTTSCIGSTTAYVATLKITGGRIEGCATGITGGGARHVTIAGTTFQNVVNFDAQSMPDLGMTITDYHSLPMPGLPLQDFVFGKGPASCWDGLMPLGHLEGISWESQRGSIWFLNNYNGDGKHYQLFNTCQLGSRPAPYSVGDNTEAVFTTPEVGLTMLQSWNKYGVAMFGEAVDDAKAITLPGLVNGFAREGTASALGPPRFVITSPTLRAPAFIFDDGSPKKQIRLYGLMAGRIADAPGVGYLSIDGGPRFVAAQSPIEKSWSDDRRPQFDAPADGVHTGRTWRSDAANVPIEATAVDFQFVVGAAAPPLTVAVPNVVGQTQAMASAAIMAAKLVVGGVKTAASTSPVGTVTMQTPAAGVQATQGGSVDLTLSSGQAMVTVPNVVGLEQGAASTALVAAGLLRGAVALANNATVLAGNVISQTPSAGAAVAPQSAVNLVVSSGPVVTPPPTTDIIITLKLVCKVDGPCTWTVVKP